MTSEKCPGCGSEFDFSIGELGCPVCLFQAGLHKEEPIQESDRFAQYVIARNEDGSPCELGRGAMGVTFRALDTTLQRHVALKIIDPQRHQRERSRERFMREARTAAGLRHENIATIHHFGVHESTGQYFYAMELVEGETLEERVHRAGPIDAVTAIAIARQVAAALGAAEKRGLIHRDLKPENIMLIKEESGENPSPKVKIIDFGLAKAATAEADPMTITHDGFVGSPAFASPEQFAQRPLDIRSDIFSLGSTLWYALTGRHPFAGENPAEIALAQKAKALSLGQLQAARVPASLGALLKSMLALEPAARPSPRELTLRLEKISGPGFVKIFATAAVLILLAVFSALHFWPNKTSELSGSTNPAAREAYLKGLFIWNKRLNSEYPQAERYFHTAIARDPHYALAYAGLSDLLQFLAFDPRRRATVYTEAEAAARQALALDPNLAEAHAALGLIDMNWKWDWAAAEREFRRAIELNPGYVTGHHWLAEYLCAQGRFDESVREMERAREISPTLPVILRDFGKTLFLAGRDREAEARLREAIALDPANGSAHYWLAQVYARTGRFTEAQAEVDRTEELDRDYWSTGLAAYVYGLAGDSANASRMLAQTRKRFTDAGDELPLVWACVGVGDKDGALTSLEHDCKTRSTTMTSLRVAPWYDSLRSDPRFADLLRRVHLIP